MTEYPEPVTGGLRECVAEAISAVEWVESAREISLRMADAALATVQPVFEAKDAEIAAVTTQRDEALAGESRARQECNELYELVSLLKRELRSARQAHDRTFNRLADIENEDLGR